MTRRDIVGAIVLTLLFVALIAVMVLTLRPKGSGSGFKDSPIVQQRMINLQKSNSKSP